MRTARSQEGLVSSSAKVLIAVSVEGRQRHPQRGRSSLCPFGVLAGVYLGTGNPCPPGLPGPSCIAASNVFGVLLIVPHGNEGAAFFALEAHYKPSDGGKLSQHAYILVQGVSRDYLKQQLLILHVHILLLCKGGSARPLGNNNGVCAFGILEPELDGGQESQALLGACCVVVFDELDNRCNHILLGHLVVLHVAFPEPAVEAFGLDYAVEELSVPVRTSTISTGIAIRGFQGLIS